jgi:hypothetical protein
VSKETIKQHEGSKYLKPIYSPVEKDENDRPAVIHVDVYAVLEAFDVKCPAIAHCIKKLLMPGQRGKGNIQADLKGAMAALNRAIELQDIREGSPREHKQVVKIPTTTESAMPTDPEELKARLAEVTGKTDETLEKVAESAGIGLGAKAEEIAQEEDKKILDTIGEEPDTNDESPMLSKLKDTLTNMMNKDKPEEEGDKEYNVLYPPPPEEGN